MQILKVLGFAYQFSQCRDAIGCWRSAGE